VTPQGEAALARVAPLLFVLLWSSAFVAVRAGLPDVSPLYFLTVRFAAAAAILIALALAFRQSWETLRGRWWHLALAGALINGFYLSAGYLAMTKVTGATLALIGGLQPILVAALSGPLLGERIRPRQWLGFALGILGVSLVVGLKAADPQEFQGVLWGLASVVCMTAGTLHYSRYGRGAALLPGNAVQLSSAAVVCALLTLGFEDVRAHWTPVAVATLLWLIGAVSLGGMALFLLMLKRGAAGRVSANFYLTPGVTALMGWAILGETLEPLALLGLAVASAGVWLVNRPAAPARKESKTDG